ncbi:MAG: hypothetical protein QM705_09735 [Ancrocorticia sp.]
MRPLELAVVVVSVVALAVLVVPRSRPLRWFGHLPITPLIATFAQVVAEGARWQLFPAYCLSVALAGVWLRRLQPVSERHPGQLSERRRRPRRLLTYLAFGVGAVMLTASVAAATAFPVFRFPEPSGPYKIGTLTYHWVDEERREIFSADPSAKREVMAQVWYPADIGTRAQRAPYASDARALSKGLTSNMSASGALRLPSFMFDHFRYVETHAVRGAVVAENRGSGTVADSNDAGYPVLIYLTGFSGWSSTNTVQVQELVSRGYVVVGLDQPYTAAAVTFPDGRVVQALDRTRERGLVDQSIAPADPAPELNGLVLEDGIIPYLAEDVSLALDKLADINAGGVAAAELTDGDEKPAAGDEEPVGKMGENGAITSENIAIAGENGILTGALDLDSVGIFGTSLGSMASAQACHNDPRIKACLMMDAAMPVAVAQSGLRQPAMWLTREADLMRLEREKSGGWNEDEIRVTQGTMRAAFEKSGSAGDAGEPADGYGTDSLGDQNGAVGHENDSSGNKNTAPGRYFVELPGAFHVDFTDAPLWTPIAAMIGISGPQGAQTPGIVGTYMLAFFDEALRGEPTSLLDGSSQPYPGVTIRSESMETPWQPRTTQIP